MNASIRILYLEDDAADARLLREQLRRSGLDCVVTVVASREAFEAQVAAGDFDVVLCDYHLPRFSGLEALEVVRAHDPQLPFILVTGALGDERAVDLLRSGATDFVLKDRLARLAPAIDRALVERAALKLREQAEARLADAQRLSKLAADAAHMGTWQLDVESGKLDCSDEFLHLIGVERSHWPGTASALDALVHPDDVERCRRLQADAIRRGQFMEIEFRIRRPDGEVRWMQSRGECARGASAQPLRFFGVIMDITQRKQMEDALREADQRKDQFLATLAHELRNPLAPIYNGLRLLRSSVMPSREIDQVHGMLERQLKHIIRLVDDLLDVSRITLGKIELRRERVELETVVRGAVEMSAPIIESARHHLQLSLPAEPLAVEGDPVRLTQALSNLLNNAAKYTDEGGEISLSVHRQDHHALVSVQDNGTGIPAGMLERVFDMFVQVERTDGRARPGLGIGLTMVRLLIKLHGGEVEARSEGMGKGSQFIVRLPLASVASESLEASASTELGSLHCSRRVLVVDDNIDFADSLAKLLRLAGADTEVVYDGASALASISLRPPEVVLLDLGMSGIDGYAVAQRIREDPRCQGVTLVALTGWGQEQDRLRTRAAGFDHHLTKPVDPLVLQSLLNALEPHRESGAGMPGAAAA
jgi:PAS domain S-box-containing protein